MSLLNIFRHQRSNLIDLNDSHSVEFLAQLAILEKQVTQVKAEIALNEGLQRRVKAQAESQEVLKKSRVLCNAKY